MPLWRNRLKFLYGLLVTIVLASSATFSHASQLSTDARTAIPHDIQQLVVIDYRAMQESPAAMALRNRVMLPELKQLEDALQNSGLNDNHDIEQLAFAIFRYREDSDETAIVGIAQGQFSMTDILANFKKQKIKPTLIRTNKIYPMGTTGLEVTFLDASTMLFGGSAAMKVALNARDGNAPNMLTNATIMDAMHSVESEPLWSILDKKGTETMMHQVLGQASGLTDFDTVKKRLQASWYTMNFQHGVHFDLTISTGDTFTAATISSLLNAAVQVRKVSGTDTEKAALAATNVSSDSGKLSVHFSTTDTEFESLLKSPLFQGMVH
jgi:hypothetical protein